MAREPTITQESVEGWHAHLEDFKKVAFPLLAEHGLTMSEALMLWELNKVTNALNAIHEYLQDRDAPG